ncbi:MAG TPA: dinitrogenase iron-molybdenum cofactor biosynthesis protein [Firmicutes bacterium]|nr:dinitrogenase iron-molybdenum cofactor biosynthesis protein [Bacillota bacterium]
MILAITAQGTDLDSSLVPRFGRCRYFILVDLESGESKALANQAVTESGGAGPQGAQFLADNNVGAVITGNVGPNAMRALQAAGIKVYSAASGTVRDALESYKKGKLAPLSEATVGSHSGLGRN